MQALLPASFLAIMLTISAAAQKQDDKSDQNAETGSALKIVSRKDWGAKPPTAPMKEHTLKLITIHHTGAKQNPKKSVEEKLRGLQAFSQREGELVNGKKKRAWPDVPYHFYVTVKGEIAEGREIKYVGDTNTEYDPTGHILVTLEGNFETEQPTDEQFKAACALIKWLAKKYKVPGKSVKTHKDYAMTACPGANLYKRVSEMTAGLDP